VSTLTRARCGAYSAAPDCCPPLIFNAGVLVLRPSAATFTRLLQAVAAVAAVASRGAAALRRSRWWLTTVYGDQARALLS
jgi:hypothetical protein